MLFNNSSFLELVKSDNFSTNSLVAEICVTSVLTNKLSTKFFSLTKVFISVVQNGQCSS